MKILVLNCGSSSIKYALYNMDDNSVMTSGGAERVGLDGAFVKVKLANGEKKQIMHDIREHTEGVKFIFSLLTDSEIGVIKSLSEIPTRLPASFIFSAAYISSSDGIQSPLG